MPLPRPSMEASTARLTCLRLSSDAQPPGTGCRQLDLYITYTYYIDNCNLTYNSPGVPFTELPMISSEFETSNAAVSDLALTILLVADPSHSAAFYRDLLGAAPVEQSPTFAMFILPSGAGIGLWSTGTVAPPPASTPGACELCFREENVDAVYTAWVARGIRMAQAPTDMDFGRTFVALDPDDHRLRVFRPAPPSA